MIQEITLKGVKDTKIKVKMYVNNTRNVIEILDHIGVVVRSN